MRCHYAHDSKAIPLKNMIITGSQGSSYTKQRGKASLGGLGRVVGEAKAPHRAPISPHLSFTSDPSEGGSVPVNAFALTDSVLPQ